MTQFRVSSKTFGWDEQEEFARLSFDYNPMHMDPLAARRTQAGRPVIHGINAALWALDQLAEHGLLQSGLVECKTQFRKLMYVGEAIDLWLVRASDSRLSAELRIGATTTASITLSLAESAQDSQHVLQAVESEPVTQRAPKVWLLEDLEGKSGELPVNFQAAEKYPAAAGIFGAARVAFFVALSRLVGMEVPGLHSMFTQLRLIFEYRDQDSSRLSYRVEEADNRFQLVTLAVSGCGLAGTVTAVVRTPPVTQAGMSEVTTMVRPDEFQGTTALVIGGSRGLGELVAKLIAAGGGRVIATYAVGRLEAESVQQDIRNGGGLCDIMSFDARKPAAEQLENLESSPTHLYYFATNQIFRRADQLFSQPAFLNFCRFYVEGFYDTCMSLIAGGRVLRVLYPSSTALNERPAGMTEYAMAKAAGEALCQDMNRSIPGVRISVARLPRLVTDQTATTVAIETQSAIDVLLPLIRELQF